MMAYDKDKLFEQAINAAINEKCFFIEQVVSFMPCDKTTFYKYFTVDSHELNAIKDIIENRKIEAKAEMYNKWFKSDNPTLQVGLMKLICTDEEAHRLNGSKQNIDHTTKGEKINDLSRLSTSELKERASAVRQIESEND